MKQSDVVLIFVQCDRGIVNKNLSGVFGSIQCDGVVKVYVGHFRCFDSV